jgi:oxalate decarboxylase/phosphoglucose isomerase-like protein (cupin superfamily)
VYNCPGFGQLKEVRMNRNTITAAVIVSAVVAYGALTRAQAPAQAPAAQAAVPPPEAPIQAGAAPYYAFDISKADIDYVLKNAPPSPPDRQLRVVDMGKYNLGVGIIHRGPTNDKPGDPVPVLWHDYTPEIYYIVSGSGTLTTGGVILNQRPGRGVPNTMNGPGGSGIAGPGAFSRRVSAGDIIIIPNKVAHGWSGVTDHVDYLSFRPDPDRVLPAGWVYPLLMREPPTEVPTPGVGRGGARGRGGNAPAGR